MSAHCGGCRKCIKAVQLGSHCCNCVTESEYERIERVRTEFLARMARSGTAPRPNHIYQDFTYDERDGKIYAESCARCPRQSPFKNDRLSHPYVIEEDPF